MEHNSTHQLQEIKEMLVDLAFEQARKKSLVRTRDQIKIRLELTDTETDELNEDDWGELLSADFNRNEKDFLLLLRNAGNKPLNMFEHGFTHKTRLEFQKKMSSLCAPYRLARVNWGCCVKKHIPLHEIK